MPFPANYLPQAILNRNGTSAFRETFQASASLQEAVLHQLTPYAEAGFQCDILGEGGRGLVISMTPPGGTSEDAVAIKLEIVQKNVRLDQETEQVLPKLAPDILSGGAAHQFAYRTLKAITTDIVPVGLPSEEMLAVTTFPIQDFISFSRGGNLSIPENIDKVEGIRAISNAAKYKGINRNMGVSDLDNEVADIATGGGVARLADVGWTVMTPGKGVLYVTEEDRPLMRMAPRRGSKQIEYEDIIRAHEQHRLILVNENGVHIPTIPGESMTLGELHDAGIITVSPSHLLARLGYTAGNSNTVQVAAIPPIPEDCFSEKAAASWEVRANEFDQPRGFMTHYGPLLSPAKDKAGAWIRTGNLLQDTHIEYAEHAIEQPVYFLKGKEERQSYLCSLPAQRVEIMWQAMHEMLDAERERAHLPAGSSATPDTFWGRLYAAQIEAMEAGHPSIHSHRTSQGLTCELRQRPEERQEEQAQTVDAEGAQAAEGNRAGGFLKRVFSFGRS